MTEIREREVKSEKRDTYTNDFGGDCADHRFCICALYVDRSGENGNPSCFSWIQLPQ